MKYAIGVDIGGTKCAVALGSFDGGSGQEINIFDIVKFPTEPRLGPDNAMERIFGQIAELMEKHHLNPADISGIGISCGGPLDSRRGRILSPPNLIGWDDIPVVELFEKKLGIRTKLQNDANACALAEWKFGAGKGLTNVIFLTFGTGMGAGLILNGALYSGTNDMAGEVGHMKLADFGPVGYGKAGSFEGFCSGGGIAQLARVKVLEQFQRGEKVSFCSGPDELEHLNAKIVGDAAEAGNELAAEIYRICGLQLGRGLSILIDTLNPEMIILGSIFARSECLLRDAMTEVIEQECLPQTRKVCRIVPAMLGESLGDYAALAVALNE